MKTATHVCALGASAGGLQPLEAFFDAVPPDSGLSYVVIQHLSPDHESMMATLLGRHTDMVVEVSTDGVLLEADHIYLIPPNTEMTVVAGRLRLRSRGTDRTGPPRPINIFFESMAQDYGERAIAIVLSGTGTDGALGVEMVRDAGGLTLAQDDTAAFEGMPEAARLTGAIDASLSPQDLPQSVLAFAANGVRPTMQQEYGLSEPASRILRAVATATGVDFNDYKMSTIQRRIERRIEATESLSADAYASLVERDSVELDNLVQEMLIDVSNFFRDPEMFEILASQVIPKLIESCINDGRTLRLWSAACAGGEEAYSLAMLAMEAAEEFGLDAPPIQVFATDIHPGALDTARAGLYSETTMGTVNAHFRDKYFTRTDNGWQIHNEVRSRVTVARHNLLADAPFTKMDLVSCRNLLIYFRPSAQEQALGACFTGLRKDGTLVLGGSESISFLGPDVDVVSREWRIYTKRREDALRAHRRVAMPTRRVLLDNASLRAPRTFLPDHRLLRAYDAILDAQFVSGVLIDSRNQLAHTFGDAGKWMRPPRGRATFDITQLVEDPTLRLAVTSTLRQLSESNEPNASVSRRVVMGREDGGQERAVLSGRRFDVADTSYRLLYLHPVSTPLEEAALAELDPAMSSVRQEQLEADLAYTRESLQAAVEEQEAFNEELHATNEELIASNEELQSTNEELSSVNEELRTLNDENQRRIDEIMEITADLEQLLSTSEIAVVFLDDSGAVRRFSDSAREFFRVRDTDIGRPLEELATGLDHQTLMNHVREVFAGAEPVNRRLEVDDKTLSLRVDRYQLPHGRRGVFLAIVDITNLVSISDAEARFRALLGEAPAVIFAKDPAGRYTYLNDASEETTRARLGLTFEEAFPDADHEQNDRSDQEVRELNQPVEYLSTVPVNGRDVTYVMLKFPLPDGGIGGVAIDITKLEDILDLKYERGLFRSLAAMSSAGAFVFRGPGAIDPLDVYDEPIIDLRTSEANAENIHPLDRDQIGQQFQQAVAAGDSFDERYRYKGVDGEYRWIRHVARPVEVEDHDTVHLSVAVDIDEAVRTEEQLRGDIGRLESQMASRMSDLEANVDALAERNADLDSFAHAAAHDLRAPVRSILSFSQMARENAGDRDTLEFLERIEAACGRMSTMVDSLLTFASAGRDELEFGPVEVDDVVAGVLADHAVAIEASGAVIDVAPLGRVSGDTGALRQVVSNLVSNALKYNDSNPVVAISASTDGATRTIEVTDNGIGFDQAVASEIFEPFKRLHSRDEFPGSGVGLAISRRLVQRMDGDLWATSTPGEGTTMRIRLPAAD